MIIESDGMNPILKGKLPIRNYKKSGLILKKKGPTGYWSCGAWYFAFHNICL